MVMTCTTDSCTGRIFGAADCLFTPVTSTYSAIASVAKKIADFVTGIFTAIANFVKYCLSMSSEAVATATNTPALTAFDPLTPTPVIDATPLPVATATPASTAALPTTPAPVPTPAASLSSPTIDINNDCDCYQYASIENCAACLRFIDYGKEILVDFNTLTTLSPNRIELSAALDPKKKPNLVLATLSLLNESSTNLRAGLVTEEQSRLAFATLLIQCSIILPIGKLHRVVAFIRECQRFIPGHISMEQIFRLRHSFDLLDEPLGLKVLEWFKGTQSTDEQKVADFFRDAEAIRTALPQCHLFSAAADAARLEL